MSDIGSSIFCVLNAFLDVRNAIAHWSDCTPAIVYDKDIDVSGVVDLRFSCRGFLLCGGN